MLISQALNEKINEQIGYEFAASIQYTAIASHFDAESLPFFARHFYKQAAEEHASKFQPSPNPSPDSPLPRMP